MIKMQALPLELIANFDLTVVEVVKLCLTSSTLYNGICKNKAYWTIRLRNELGSAGRATPSSELLGSEAMPLHVRYMETAYEMLVCGPGRKLKEENTRCIEIQGLPTAETNKDKIQKLTEKLIRQTIACRAFSDTFARIVGPKLATTYAPFRCGLLGTQPDWQSDPEYLLIGAVYSGYTSIELRQRGFFHGHSNHALYPLIYHLIRDNKPYQLVSVLNLFLTTTIKGHSLDLLTYTLEQAYEKENDTVITKIFQGVNIRPEDMTCILERLGEVKAKHVADYLVKEFLAPDELTNESIEHVGRAKTKQTDQIKIKKVNFIQMVEDIVRKKEESKSSASGPACVKKGRLISGRGKSDSLTSPYTIMELRRLAKERGIAIGGSKEKLIGKLTKFAV